MSGYFIFNQHVTLVRPQRRARQADPKGGGPVPAPSPQPNPPRRPGERDSHRSGRLRDSRLPAHIFMIADSGSTLPWCRPKPAWSQRPSASSGRTDLFPIRPPPVRAEPVEALSELVPFDRLRANSSRVNQVQFGSAPSNRHGQGQVACMQGNAPRNKFNTPIGTL